MVRWHDPVTVAFLKTVNVIRKDIKNELDTHFQDHYNMQLHSLALQALSSVQFLLGFLFRSKTTNKIIKIFQCYASKHL